MRYWYLHELRRLRAARRVGTITEPNARKERKLIITELIRLRKGGQPEVVKSKMRR